MYKYEDVMVPKRVCKGKFCDVCDGMVEDWGSVVMEIPRKDDDERQLHICKECYNGFVKPSLEAAGLKGVDFEDEPVSEPVVEKIDAGDSERNERLP